MSFKYDRARSWEFDTYRISLRTFAARTHNAVATGADRGFLKRGFIYIKEWGFALLILSFFFLNIPWKWNNMVSLRPNYFNFIGYLKGGGGRFKRTSSWIRRWSDKLEKNIKYQAKNAPTPLIGDKYQNLINWSIIGSLVKQHTVPFIGDSTRSLIKLHGEWLLEEPIDLWSENLGLSGLYISRV